MKESSEVKSIHAMKRRIYCTLLLIVCLSFCDVLCVKAFVPQTKETTIPDSKETCVHTFAFGSGTTKEEAVNLALKNAFKRVYSAFVSSSSQPTEEYVTSGVGKYIKKHSIILQNTVTDDKSTHVLINAIVSIDSLQQETTNGKMGMFSGQAQFNDKKKIIHQFYKSNELYSVQLLLKELSMMKGKIYSYNLTVKDPVETKMNQQGMQKTVYQVDLKISMSPNDLFKRFVIAYMKALRSLSVSKQAYDKALEKNIFNTTRHGLDVGIYQYSTPTLSFYQSQNEDLSKEHMFYLRNKESVDLLAKYIGTGTGMNNTFYATEGEGSLFQGVVYVNQNGKPIDNGPKYFGKTIYQMRRTNSLSATGTIQLYYSLDELNNVQGYTLSTDTPIIPLSNNALGKTDDITESQNQAEREKKFQNMFNSNK